MEYAPKDCSAMHRPVVRDEVGYEHDGDQHIAMRYGRGIFMVKTGENLSTWGGKHPEERDGKTAENGVEGF